MPTDTPRRSSPTATERAESSERILYVNGGYVPASRAKISVFDHVVLYGDGVAAFDIYNANEAFLSSTTGGIFPIASPDGRTVGSWRRGPITKGIAEAYEEMVTGATAERPRALNILVTSADPNTATPAPPPRTRSERCKDKC